MFSKTVSGLLLAIFLAVLGAECFEDAFGYTISPLSKSQALRDILVLTDPSIEKIEVASTLKKKAFRIISSQNTNSYLSPAQGIAVRWVREKPPRAGKAPPIYKLYRVLLI